MKLLTLTHFFACHRGGIEIVAEQLDKALAATGPAGIIWVASDADRTGLTMILTGFVLMLLPNNVEKMNGR